MLGAITARDIMIAARDAAAIQAEDCEFVMGELHMGVVTCDHILL
jgi:hypothetical protein